MGITSDELRVFVQATRVGSLGGAARSLAVSQPSASERLAQLERKMATRLLERSPRGVTLTAGGARFLPYASRCLELLDDALRAVRDDAGTETFTLGLHGMFSALVGRAIELLGDRPLQIATRDAHSEQIIDLLVDGEVDAGIVVEQPHPPSITLRRILVTPAIAVASPTHPLARQRHLNVVDLAGSPVAANVWGRGADRFFDLLLQAQLSRHHIRVVATAETATQLARHHGHVAVLFQASVADDLASGGLTRLPVADLPSWTLELYLAHRSADKDRREVVALRRLSRMV